MISPILLAITLYSVGRLISASNSRWALNWQLAISLLERINLLHLVAQITLVPVISDGCVRPGGNK